MSWPCTYLLHVLKHRPWAEHTARGAACLVAHGIALEPMWRLGVPWHCSGGWCEGWVCQAGLWRCPGWPWLLCSAGAALRAAVPDHRAHGSVPAGQADDPAAVQAPLRSLHARVPAVLPSRGTQGLPGEVCAAGDEDLWWVFNNNLHKSLQCRLHWWAPFLC